MEANGFFVDESEQARNLFGGKIAFKNFGNGSLDPCQANHNPPLVYTKANICQKYIRSQFGDDTFDESEALKIRLPEPKNLAQYRFFAAAFSSKFFWLGMYIDEKADCDAQNLKSRKYNFMSGEGEVSWLNEVDPWAPGEPNECGERYISSTSEGTADFEAMRTEPNIICVYIEESHNQAMCSPDFVHPN